MHTKSVLVKWCCACGMSYDIWLNKVQVNMPVRGMVLGRDM